MPAKDGLAIKNKGFVVTTCMTSVNPAKNTPQRMAQTKWRKGEEGKKDVVISEELQK